MNLECHPGSFFYDNSNSIKAMDLYWEFEARNKSLKKQEISRKKDNRKLDLLLNQKKVSL